ncbi:MAG: UDP-N-acetylmuramoyl-tripeptide--D-alanyl-D-alanine ligase, partial [Clostridia bacterium]|nr:UDP-N-acetylmuramoyl-tripeptide--D-alanyl-D-alanine ligase [Clostridia bacterium]
MKKDIIVKDIIEITKGNLITGDENTIFDNFSKNSKEVKEGDFYLGFKGETTNGGIFFEEALNNGAKGCIIQDVEITEEHIEKYKDKVIIKVDDVVNAVQEIAKFKRNLYNIPVIAITGSVGKTSTKDIVAGVVSEKYKTLKTQGNYNNHIGLPLTILNLREHEALVVEMGMNHFGEISVLTKIARPTVAIITNVGTAHIGILGSRENILKAKLEILEGLQEGGKIIINNDNDLLHNWYEENKDKYDIVTYGIDNESDLMAEDIASFENGSKYILKGENKSVNVPVGGNHFVQNSLCAIAVGKILQIETDKIIDGIKKFELTKRRMDITKLENGVTIINDCYNANFDSMKAALEYLGKIQDRRKIAVLGDMLELGDYSKKLHEMVGIEVAKNNIDILITVGNDAKYIA